jgi:hypothetical protein
MEENQKNRIVDALRQLIGPEEGKISDAAAMRLLHQAQNMSPRPKNRTLVEYEPEFIKKPNESEPVSDTWYSIASRASEIRRIHGNTKHNNIVMMAIELEAIAPIYQKMNKYDSDEGPVDVLMQAEIAMHKAKVALERVISHPSAMVAMFEAERSLSTEAQHRALAETSRLVTPARLITITKSDTEILRGRFGKAIAKVPSNRPTSPNRMAVISLAAIWQIGFGEYPITQKSGSSYGPAGDAWREWLLEVFPLITGEGSIRRSAREKANLKRRLEQMIARNSASWAAATTTPDDLSTEE